MSDFATGLEKAFLHVPGEGTQRITPTGDIPAWMRGTYYLNGPARFVRGDFHYRHWLDGDGMVCRLVFNDDGVTLTHRYVRTTKLVDEEEAGRPLYRTFGTAFEGDRLLHRIAIASPVNISIHPFAGTLLAFGEQGLPWELDFASLETKGEHTFGHRINAISPFSAHVHFDRETGEMFNFGVSFASAQPSVTLYRFTADGELALRKRLPLAEPCSMHDFGLSKRHAVFFVAPYLLDIAALMKEGATIQSALNWQPEKGSHLLIVDRESGEKVAELPVGNRYCLHQINCFEQGDRLFFDLLELEEPAYPDYETIPDLFIDVRPCHPVRLVVDLNQGTLVERQEIDFQLAGDFPTIHPELASHAYRHFWILAIEATGQQGRKFFDRLVHFDWQANGPQQGSVVEHYQSPPGKYLGGEPVFIPHPDNDEVGAILCQEFDAETTRVSFLLFDAFDLPKGPIARLPLASPVHLGLHACWHAEKA